MIIRKPQINFGSNPFRFLGAYYAVATYPFEKRPMITLHMIWLVVWIRAPFEHFRKMDLDSRYGWHCNFRRGDAIKSFAKVIASEKAKRR